MDTLKSFLLSGVAFLCIFFLAIGILGLVFMKFWPKDSVFWKRVDYLWLLMAALGGVAAINQNRLFVEKTAYDSHQVQVQYARGRIYQQIVVGVNSYLCAAFVDKHGKLSGAQSKEDHERAAQCRWFQQAKKRYEETPLNRPIVNMGENENYAVPLGPDRTMFSVMRQYVSEYNRHEAIATELRVKSTPTPFDESLRYFGPFIIAVALALRFLKAVVDVDTEIPKRTGPILGRNEWNKIKSLFVRSD